MRVQLEYSGQTVDLEDNSMRIVTESDFLDLLERALKAIDVDVEIRRKS